MLKLLILKFHVDLVLDTLKTAVFLNRAGSGANRVFAYHIKFISNAWLNINVIKYLVYVISFAKVSM